MKKDPRYTLVRTLGEGGMGQVFAAQDHLLEREIAIKQIKGDSQFHQDLFIREAQMLAKLHHPNIPPIHDLILISAPSDFSRETSVSIEDTSMNQTKIFFTMEKVNGESLGTLIQRWRQCDPKDAEDFLYRLLDIFVSSCDAVQYAHDQGLLHRDLKPENIMIGERSEVKVLDWGLSGLIQNETVRHKGTSLDQIHPSEIKEDQTLSSPVENPLSLSSALQATLPPSAHHRDHIHPENASSFQESNLPTLSTRLDSSLYDTLKVSHDASHSSSASSIPFTFTGTISGTPAYMSPEQARGETLTVQADVYALGATLYEILSGYAPYVRDYLHDEKAAFKILKHAQNRETPPPLQRKNCPHPHLINRYLIKICMTALQPDCKNRYPSVAALMDEVRKYITGQNQRAQSSTLKKELRTHFVSAQKLIHHIRSADTLWQRQKATKLHQKLAYTLAIFLRGLHALVRWDKFDIEARLWGIQFRYQYMMLLWEQGQYDEIYFHIKENLIQRAHLFDMFQTGTLEKILPWSDIKQLQNPQRKVHLCTPPENQRTHKASVLSCVLSPLRSLKSSLTEDCLSEDPLIDHLWYEQTISDLSPRETHSIDVTSEGEIDFTLFLPWGFYQLELTYQHLNQRTQSVQVFQVPPPNLPLFFSQKLLNLSDFTSKAIELTHSTSDQTPIQVILDPPSLMLPPSLPSLSSTPTSSILSDQSSSEFDSDSSDSDSKSEFKWIAHHLFTKGTANPLYNSLSPQKAESGRLWMQQYPLTIGHYLYFLEGLQTLVHSLTDDAYHLGCSDLEKTLPKNSLPIKELREPLILKVDRRFTINPRFIAMKITPDVPMIWLSFMQLQRYLLWWNRFVEKPAGSLWVIPSEDEWELASRGVDQRLFPWGDADPDQITLNRNHPHSPIQSNTPHHTLSRVHWKRLFPNDLSPFGIEALGGGFSDWTIKESAKQSHRQDLKQWIHNAPPKSSPLSEQAYSLVFDPLWRSTFETEYSVDQFKSNLRVLRGGSYANSNSKCSVAYRYEALPFKNFDDVTIRLAWLPE